VRYAGWYARRRGLLQHLDEGTISLLDSAVHDFLCLTCDYRTGVAWASAEKIKALSPADISLRAIQRSLARLEQIGWIKRFRIHGKRGNYPVVVGKYFVADTSLMWKSVNLESTKDWRSVQFDAVTDPSFVDEVSCHPPVSDPDSDPSRSKELRSEEHKKQDGDPVTGDSRVAVQCCLKIDPWAFTGLDRNKIDKKSMAEGFEVEFSSVFEKYRQEYAHDDDRCFCDPAEFLDLVMDHFEKIKRRYPSGLLLLKKRLDHMAKGNSDENKQKA
jgi:hypothetical protein